MQLYAGLDLHSRNTYIGIMDKEFKRVFNKRVANKLPLILATLKPFQNQLKGIVVESTFNWYWLIDGLMNAGYHCMHLANPAAMKQYEGIKHTDDQHDAFFLAQMLILGILPQGYIYPKEDRPVRDLARKRLFLVRHKTSHILSLQSLIARCSGQRVSANEIRKFTVEDLQRLLEQEYIVLSAQANLDTIVFLKQQIRQLEKAIQKKVKLSKSFQQLMTVPGIGLILAMTIMLEVGDIGRFPQVGNFASYSRCVSSQRLSDGKSKGHGNRKNGNRYLSWAFTEAAHLSRRYNERFRSYYNRKVAQANTSLATKALSNKLARICYYIMRDQVPFRENLLSQ
ncbi:MAG: IS110 family transposase [Desulfobacteraceae bacterium]|jgi:transposase|nr:IS110 family transposase [Desulfobacteraceae bacterium]